MGGNNPVQSPPLYIPCPVQSTVVCGWPELGQSLPNSISLLHKCSRLQAAVRKSNIKIRLPPSPDAEDWTIDGLKVRTPGAFLLFFISLLFITSSFLCYSRDLVERCNSLGAVH